MTDANHFSKYRRRETFVSAGINMVFSAVFYLIVFGTSGEIPVRGLGNFAFDFLPQSAAIGLMGSLVPGLLMRRALARGNLSGIKVQVDTRAFLGIVGRTVLAATSIGALLFFVFGTYGPDQIGGTTALVQKLAYGASLGAVITWTTLSSIFGSFKGILE